MALTEYQVRTAKPGRHHDGNGLSLLVDKATYRGTTEHRKKWVFRIQIDGKRQDIGIGSARSKSGVTLAEARSAAYEMRRAFRRGEDPVAERKKERQEIPTFRQAALEYIALNRDSWKSAKHGAQWLATYPNASLEELALMLETATQRSIRHQQATGEVVNENWGRIGNKTAELSMATDAGSIVGQLIHPGGLFNLVHNTGTLALGKLSGGRELQQTLDFCHNAREPRMLIEKASSDLRDLANEIGI